MGTATNNTQNREARRGRWSRRAVGWASALTVLVTAGGVTAAIPAIVDGSCYLEGYDYPLHCNSAVEIDGSVLHLPATSDCSGHFSWLAVAPIANHMFSYEHVGYWPEEQMVYVPIGGTTLPPVTLDYKGSCGILDYPYCPPEWDGCFPGVEGVHKPTSVYRVEWWYVNFRVTRDTDGREYAGFVAFFKPPVLGSPGMTLISIIDLKQGVQYSDAKFPVVFTASDQYLDVVDGLDGKLYNRTCCGDVVPFEYHVHASGADGGVAWVDLDLKALKRPMLVSGDGFVEFDSETWSYYYSHPRLDVIGRLHLPGFPALGEKVHGTAWIDHQWANLPDKIVTWEWLSIQLDDGREIMVADVWKAGEPLGSFSGGLNFYDEDCTLEVLGEYELTAIDSWEDPVTGKEFATAWQVTEPERAIDLIVTAEFEDQIMRIGENQILPACFWEGACTVGGSIDGVAVDGMAMAEVTHLHCHADITDDGAVDVVDLLQVLADWGECPAVEPPICPADLNDDGVVDVVDLLEVLSSWGSCGASGEGQFAGQSEGEFEVVP